MRKAFWILLALFVLAAPAAAGDMPFLEYNGSRNYLPQTPSVTGGGVGGFGNPAAFATTDEGMFDFWWNDRSLRKGSLDNWGLAFGKGLGFSMQRSVLPYVEETGGEPETSTFSLYDYQIGLAGGDRRGYFGMGWRFSGGRSGLAGRKNAFTLGAVGRPNRYASYGLSGLFAIRTGAAQGVFDLGVRPLGTPLVTLFGDYSMRENDNLKSGLWGAGFEVRPWRGIHVGMKFHEIQDDPDRSWDYSINAGITLDGLGFHILPRYDDDHDRGTTSYLVRISPPYKGLPLAKEGRARFGNPVYVGVNLENKAITYQTPQWFVKRQVAWIDLARHLDKIKDEPSAKGVAINLAGTRMSPAIAWEFRNKIEELQDAGLEIAVHIDRVEMIGFYVASVANRLTIDPQGDVLLPGMAIHRTYMRGLLDKLGIGIEEWRYFTHKSAMEGYVRKDMSETDKEQIGRLIDVFYEETRTAVCESRDMTEDEFDALVDDQALFTAVQALENGLVDTLARWDALGEWLGKNKGGAKLAGLPYDRDHGIYHDEVWGRPKEIAVVYAIGECAMDTGIKGRKTSKYMRKLAGKKDVAAVVLRADSPGGDPLPSDLVAEATNKLKEKNKPVVVSQGFVAGSGGYWISMNGSKIYSTPLSITGSIGVIGGWFWDDGIGEKTGLSSDGVQRGKHSDIFTGTRFPLVGRMPTRNLTDEEKVLVKTAILELYDDFVVRVAEGRGLSEEKVREVGEGRIWMGRDALEHGLVDEIGGLPDAIAEARKLAGIEPEEEVIFTEYPPRPLFRFPKFGGGPLDLLVSPIVSQIAGGDSESEEGSVSYDEIYMKALAEAKGTPLLLVPPEAIPTVYSDIEK